MHDLLTVGWYMQDGAGCPVLRSFYAECQSGHFSTDEAKEVPNSETFFLFHISNRVSQNPVQASEHLGESFGREVKISDINNRRRG